MTRCVTTATDLQLDQSCKNAFGRKKTALQSPGERLYLLRYRQPRLCRTAFHTSWGPARSEALPVAPKSSLLWWGARRQPKWPATQNQQGHRGFAEEARSTTPSVFRGTRDCRRESATRGVASGVESAPGRKAIRMSRPSFTGCLWSWQTGSRQSAARVIDPSERCSSERYRISAQHGRLRPNDHWGQGSIRPSVCCSGRKDQRDASCP